MAAETVCPIDWPLPPTLRRTVLSELHVLHCENTDDKSLDLLQPLGRERATIGTPGQRSTASGPLWVYTITVNTNNTISPLMLSHFPPPLPALWGNVYRAGDPAATARVVGKCLQSWWPRCHFPCCSEMFTELATLLPLHELWGTVNRAGDPAATARVVGNCLQCLCCMALTLYGLNVTIQHIYCLQYNINYSGKWCGMAVV